MKATIQLFDHFFVPKKMKEVHQCCVAVCKVFCKIGSRQIWVKFKWTFVRLEKMKTCWGKMFLSIKWFFDFCFQSNVHKSSKGDIMQLSRIPSGSNFPSIFVEQWAYIEFFWIRFSKMQKCREMELKLTVIKFCVLVWCRVSWSQKCLMQDHIFLF